MQVNGRDLRAGEAAVATFARTPAPRRAAPSEYALAYISPKQYVLLCLFSRGESGES